MDGKLKIGLVLDDSLDKPDGVQQYVLTIGNWLSSQGHDVHYLVGNTHRTDIANIHSLGKNVAVRFNGTRMSMPLPAKREAIRDVLISEKFDVLHVQMLHSPWLAQRIILAAGPATAVVGTFHNAPYGFHVKLASRVLAAWTRPSLKRFDRVVSVSTTAQHFAKRSFKIDSTVLPNVIDYDLFASAKPFPEYQKKLTILFLGRLVPRKGCLTLLRAVNMLLQRRYKLPAFEVVICGKGPLESKLKQYVEEHHLASLVTFTGFVEEADKPRYYKSADIAVFPSTGGESFGIVLIEAMAAGALVLGGDNPGYRTVLGSEPELLFKPGDVSALADKLRLYLTDDAARKQMQAWGSDFTKRFDTATVGQQLVQIYNEALQQRRNVR